MNRPVLSFDLIDDILALTPYEYHEIAKSYSPDLISPLVELAYHSYSCQGPLRAIWPDAEVVENLAAAMSSIDLDQAANIVTSKHAPFEFIPTPRSAGEILHSKWTSYLIRAKKAAEEAGMLAHFAQALIGTLEEMAENVVSHSYAPMTGIAGYRTGKSSFEYVVADSGIGVLASLKTKACFASLTDPLEALSLAIKSGVSRMPDDLQRGNGFNGLLGNIAKNSCDLRFHSDTACIKFNGIAAQTSGSLVQSNVDAPSVSGFVISVIWQG